MAKKRKRKSNLPAVRRSASLSKPKKRRRKGLSAKDVPVIGELSVRNPLIGGLIGGFAASMIADQVKDTIFGESTDPESFTSKIQPYAKALVIGGVAWIAKRQKYPEISAGLMGYAAGKAREKMVENGVFGEGVNFADPSLLSDATLLSKGGMRGRRF